MAMPSTPYPLGTSAHAVPWPGVVAVPVGSLFTISPTTLVEDIATAVLFIAAVVVVAVFLSTMLFYWAEIVLAVVLGGVWAWALAWGHWPPFGLLASAWGAAPPGLLGATFPDLLRRPDHLLPDILRGTLSSRWWGGAGPCRRPFPPSPPPGSMRWWRRSLSRVGPSLRRLLWLLLLWMTLAIVLVSVLGGELHLFRDWRHLPLRRRLRLRFPNTYLLVGCCNDEITNRYKGKTVMTESERYESLRHCKWVDEVIPDAPWVITPEFIDKHKIDFVAHDALPYADASGAGNDVYEFVKAIGKFKETKRTNGVSTSDVIMRILKDYNEYVMRNLARGYSRKDLGVSYVKEKQLRVNMGISKLREKVKEHQEKLHTVAKTAGMHQNLWMENADRWVAGFLEKFEEGCHIMETAIKDRIQEKLRRQRPKVMTANLMQETVVA